MCLQKNCVIISGDINNSPELRKGQGDAASVCYFYLSQKDRNNNEMRFLCKVSGSVAEDIAKISTKTSVLVFGRLETTRYKTEGGEALFKEIIVAEVYPSVAGVYINKTEFAGRLTKNVEFLPAKEEKKALARTSLATNRKGADSEQVEFIDLTLFDKKAEFVQKYMGKGTPAAVSGRLVLESYTSKSGKQCVAYRVLVSSIDFTQDKGGGSVSASLPPADFVPQQASSPKTNAESVSGGFKPVSPTADGFMPMGWGSLPIN